jgi:hypothetical protein
MVSCSWQVQACHPNESLVDVVARIEECMQAEGIQHKSMLGSLRDDVSIESKQASNNATLR